MLGNQVSPLIRATLVISAVAVLVGGVTFAALQSQASVMGNTVSSVTADLLVDGNGDNTFSDAEPGFNFANIVPGKSPSSVGTFKLRNNGDVSLNVRASVAGELEVNPTELDTSKVRFAFVSTAGNVDVTLADLTAPEGVEFLNNLEADASGSVDYSVTVSIDEDAFDGEKASVESFNLVFTGTPS